MNLELTDNVSSLSLAASDGAEFDDREENDGDVVEDLTPFSPCFFLIVIIITLKKLNFILFFSPFSFFLWLSQYQIKLEASPSLGSNF